MLRDYEELLDQKSTSMKKFKDSIERILGVPYFRIAKNDLNIVKKRVENERASIIRRLGGFEYEELLSQFDFVSEEIDGLEKEITGLEERKDQLEIEVTGNKRKMSDFEEVKDNAIKRNEIERDIKIIDGDIDKLNEKIKNLNINLYKILLSPVSNNILGVLENKHKEKMEKYDKKQKLLGRLESIEKGIKTSKCEYCGTILKPEKLISLEQEKKEINIKISDLTEIPEPNTSFDLYRQTLQRMKLNLIDQNNYKEIEKEKNDKLYKKAILTQNLTEVKEKLLNSDTKEPFDLENKIREQEIEVGRLEGIIQTKNSELLELKREKSEIDQKITSIDKKELNILDTRINVISSTINIFETAINQYVEEKRSDVERESSEIFKNLRSKEDFIKLIINENYGLGILTSEGTILDKNEWRSAGEEQLVALSLIGALNKCSNVEAPIMMDTPFGRLDLKHGQRVLSYLPKMSKEVILLATDREIREDDLKEVKSNIKTDYTIKYISEKEGSKISKTRSN
jgi:DNA sulfur modification protein DndD